jgi:hypothetical protein
MLAIRTTWTRLLLTVAVGWGSLLSAHAAGAQATKDEADAKKQCFAQHEEAQVLRQGSKLREARAALLTCARDVCPSVVRGDCVDWLEQVDKSIPSVGVSVRVNGRDELNARVTVDGVLVTTKLEGKPIEVNPGVHTFKVETAPWPVNEQQVLVNEGEKNRVLNIQFGNIEAPPRPEGPAKPEYRPVPILDYVLAGTTVAGIAGFAVFGSMGKKDRDSLAKSCAPFCSSSEISKVRTKLVVADVSLGVAVASAIAAVVVYATRPAKELPDEKPKPGKDAPPKTSFGVDPLPSGAAFTLRGAF